MSLLYYYPVLYCNKQYTNYCYNVHYILLYYAVHTEQIYTTTTTM